VKRPILVLLAAALLKLGVLGAAPTWAAEPHAPATVAVPVHHHHGDDGYFHHRHHRHHYDYDDDDEGNEYEGPCAGLIVLCLG
jgi:hypothetical protein